MSAKKYQRINRLPSATLMNIRAKPDTKYLPKIHVYIFSSKRPSSGDAMLLGIQVGGRIPRPRSEENWPPIQHLRRNVPTTNAPFRRGNTTPFLVIRSKIFSQFDTVYCDKIFMTSVHIPPYSPPPPSPLLYPLRGTSSTSPADSRCTRKVVQYAQLPRKKTRHPPLPSDPPDSHG